MGPHRRQQGAQAAQLDRGTSCIDLSSVSQMGKPRHTQRTHWEPHPVPPGERWMEINGGGGMQEAFISCQLVVKECALRGPQPTRPWERRRVCKPCSVLVSAIIPHPQPETCFLAMCDGEGCVPC